MHVQHQAVEKLTYDTKRHGIPGNNARLAKGATPSAKLPGMSIFMIKRQSRIQRHNRIIKSTVT
jgi:hypothetical protein